METVEATEREALMKENCYLRKAMEGMEKANGDLELELACEKKHIGDLEKTIKSLSEKNKEGERESYPVVIDKQNKMIRELKEMCRAKDQVIEGLKIEVDALNGTAMELQEHLDSQSESRVKSVLEEKKRLQNRLDMAEYKLRIVKTALDGGCIL